MAKKSSEATEASFDITAGVTISRTLIPTLPPNFLSRKHLFHLFDYQAPSTTIVIAPAGFGKTALVSEWAQSNKERVIWLTITQADSNPEMSALLIQATRNVIPGFAPWFETDQPVRPTEVVRRWGNELLATGREFIFVLDNLRDNFAADVEIASRLVEQFPPNIHFVPLRRDSLESSYRIFSARGPLNVIGQGDLKFSDQEISSLAKAQGLDPEARFVSESLAGASGWPAAVSIVIHQLSKTGEKVEYEKVVASQREPLNSLVSNAISSLDEKSRSVISALSVVQEFNHEIAEIILGELYSYDLINGISLDGNFFSQTSDPEQTYSFTLLMREAFLTEIRKDPKRKREIHQRLVTYYESRLQPNLSLEHAYLAGDIKKVSETFPSAARVLQATGKGSDLIRWSVFAGDTSKEGLLKRATVELTGHLTALDYKSATFLIERMTFDSRGTVLEKFIYQLASGAKCYLDLALGRLEEFNVSFEQAMSPHDEPLMLALEDQVGVLRLAAIHAFIHDDTERVEELALQIEKMVAATPFALAHYLLLSVKALSQFQVGDYRRANETASLAITHARKNGYVGIFGPLDAMYVSARCLLEFSRTREAFDLFDQIRNLASQWKQWTWYFLADGYFARDLALNGRIKESLEMVRAERDLLINMDSADQLNRIIDLTEIFIRFQIKDNERLAILLERAPKLRFVQQISLALDERLGKKSVAEDVRRLPSRTPREKIWKYLADSNAVLDQENLAMKELIKALEVGATVGAKETFLRQSEAMGNLMIKIAGNNPTVYLEDLAAAVADRIKENSGGSARFAAELTKRELEVLRHLSTERPITAIAASLHISQNTMKTHLKNLYRKLEVDGRTTAVEKAKANYIL